jgi:predicted heme/steroid binding protein
VQGQQGDAGAESLVLVTPIDTDAGISQCPSGGETIQVGIDANEDGVLEQSEVQQTAYVCNGTGGDAGSPAALGASAIGGSTATQGVPYTSVFVAVTDPNTQDTANDFNVSINWGDGSFSSGFAEGADGQFSVSGPHTYSAVGTYTVNVQILDKLSGATAVTNASITVGPELSASSFTGNTAIQGVGYTSTFASIADANTRDTANDFNVSINWGDGSFSSGFAEGADGQFVVSGPHTYSAVGTYTANVQILDNVSGATAVTNASITVGPELSASSFTGNTAIQGVGYTSTFASIADANTQDTANDFNVSINWGDGSFSSGFAEGADGQFSVSGPHTYSAVGTYTANVQILDNVSGATAVTNASITVQ